MSFFISEAIAEAAPAAAQQPSMLEALLPFIILFAVFYFLLIRPQSKRAKAHRELVASMGKGDEVVTNGGMLGKVVELGDNFLLVEVADNLQIKIQRDAIANLMPKGTYKDAP
ncbi:MAG: preprotein translocase subunit YajC [Gammaproteobacteria bacterium]|nr:preprotein translocase subunit YajC [Gammaproteobacteria bacterium]